MMRGGALLLALALAGACGNVRPCRSGTVLVSLDLGSAAADADRLDLRAKVGDAVMTAVAPHTPGEAAGTLELTFPGDYPGGQPIQLSIVALRGSVELGRSYSSLALAPGCTNLEVRVGVSVDLLGEDLVGADLTGFGFADEDLASGSDDLSAGGDLATEDLTQVDMTQCGTANPAATHHVDPINGRDLPTQGGLPGACAYKTITYALTQATRIIRLAPGATYNTASGETFPLVLNGTQELDGNGGASGYVGAALINGAGGFAGMATFPAIGLQGTQNTVRNCDVVGTASLATSAIGVSTVASGGTHVIQGNRLRAGLHGVVVTAGGGNVTLISNKFESVAVSILWNSTGPGFMNTNDVVGTQAAIACSSASPNILGMSNSEGGGTPSCSGCQNCPF